MKTANTDGAITVRLEKAQVRSKKVRNPKGSDVGIGEFFLLLQITAIQRDIYIPLSIASGKKPTGFVYQIEGTAKGTIATTDISMRGEGTTQVTLGTLLYAKIPAGKTAAFRILVRMRGQPGKEYKIVINRIHYKLKADDARYEKYEAALSSKSVRL